MRGSAQDGYVFAPTYIELFGTTLRGYEAATYTGDQLVGDRGATSKVHYRYVRFARPGQTWAATSLRYPGPYRPFDYLYVYDGQRL